jgi:hypothetical protein
MDQIAGFRRELGFLRLGGSVLGASYVTAVKLKEVVV